MKQSVFTDEFAAAHQANIAALHALAAGALDRFERLTALSLNLARSEADDGAAQSRAMLEAKDAAEALRLNADAFPPRLERAAGYARGVGEIASTAHKEALEIGQNWFAELNTALVAALDQAAKSAPSGTEALFASVRSAADLASNFYDKIGEASRKASASLAAAADAAPAAESARRVTKQAAARPTSVVAPDDEA